MSFRTRTVTTRNVTGRLSLSADAKNWNHVTFQPDDGSKPIIYRVPPGSEAFLLHGILGLQPDIVATVSLTADHPIAFIDLSPANAIEWSFDHLRKTGLPDDNRVRIRETPSPKAKQSEPQTMAAEMGPSAIRIHNPIYCFTATDLSWCAPEAIAVVEGDVDVEMVLKPAQALAG